MQIENRQVVGGYVEGQTSPVALAMDPNGAVMTASNRLQKRHYTSGTVTYYAEAPLGTPTTTAGWRVWRLDTSTGADIEYAIGALGLPSDDFEFEATDALLALHNYGFIADVVVPTLSTVTIASNNTDTTKAKVGDVVTLTIISSENILSPTITIAGRAATIVAGADARHWTATQTMATGDTTGTVAFSIAFSDHGGTAGVTVTALTGGSAVTFDKTAPTALLEYSVDAGSTWASTISTKNADTLRIRATFSEALLDSPVVKLAIDNAVLAATAMTKTDTTHYYYDLNVPAGDIATATCSLSIGVDVAGNVITEAPTAGATFKIDNTVPTLSSAAKDSVTQITVTLSELALASTITKANDGGFVVTETSGVATYAVSAIAPGATNNLVVLTVADMTISAAAGVTVTYAAAVNGTVSDVAGNALATDATGVVIAAW